MIDDNTKEKLFVLGRRLTPQQMRELGQELMAQAYFVLQIAAGEIAIPPKVKTKFPRITKRRRWKWPEN
jgi:hypothetical protein